MQVNSMLREQLEQANVANAALSEDIRKLTADWARTRDELEQREVEWRREEEVWGGMGGREGYGMERGAGRDGGLLGGMCDNWERWRILTRDRGPLGRDGEPLGGVWDHGGGMENHWGGMWDHGGCCMEKNLGV